MGIEAWAVDLALIGSIAQRLLRRVCASCSGSGCERCLDTGYHGRTVIAEVLAGGQGTAQPDLRAAGETLVAENLTTADELHRVLGGAP